MLRSCANMFAVAYTHFRSALSKWATTPT